MPARTRLSRCSDPPRLPDGIWRGRHPFFLLLQQQYLLATIDRLVWGQDCSLYICHFNRSSQPVNFYQGRSRRLYVFCWRLVTCWRTRPLIAATKMLNGPLFRLEEKKIHRPSGDHTGSRFSALSSPSDNNSRLAPSTALIM